MIGRRTLFRIVATLPFLVPLVSAVDDFEIPYDVAVGTFTHFWADFSLPPNPFAMVYSFFQPFVLLLGPSVYFVIWGGIVAGAWLYTQDITTPLVIGTLSGAILAAAITTPENQIMMGLVIAFAIGGVIAKIVLGK